MDEPIAVHRFNRYDFAVFDPPDDGEASRKFVNCPKLCAILQTRQYHYFVGCAPF
jgi:hypothetical protein